jgi:hypothetical protein
MWKEFWYRRAEDGKVEYLLELAKLWREEGEKIGQTSRDFKVKKRAAPPLEPRKLSRPKKDVF